MLSRGYSVDVLLLLACTGTPSTDGVPTDLNDDAPVVQDSPTLPSDDTGPAYGTSAECNASVEPGSVPGLTRWPYLQLGGTDTMTVLWGGSKGTESAELGWGRVDTEETVAAVSETIPGKRPQKLWRATVTGLEPGTEYCYRVSLDGQVMAEGLRFRTAPARQDASVKFMVIGDFGAGTLDQLMVRDRMLEHMDGVDLLITTGDNAYHNGTWVEFDVNVFEVNQDIMHRVVTWPTSGNHDYYTDNAAPYLANFVLPENAWRAKDKERYYRVDWGPLTLLALDTEGPIKDISEAATDDQGDWLEAQLSKVNRPWVIPVFHKPGVEGHATRGPDIHVLSHFIPLFEKYSVRLALTGHNHHYERFAPLGNLAEEIVPKGVTYVVTGGGGRHLYELGDEPRRVVGIEEHHFVLGEADDCTLSLRAISKTGEELDRFALTRCN